MPTGHQVFFGGGGCSNGCFAPYLSTFCSLLKRHYLCRLYGLNCPRTWVVCDELLHRA